jgi:hypothetical protein
VVAVSGEQIHEALSGALELIDRDALADLDRDLRGRTVAVLDQVGALLRDLEPDEELEHADTAALTFDPSGLRALLATSFREGATFMLREGGYRDAYALAIALRATSEDYGTFIAGEFARAFHGTHDDSEED